MRVIPRVDRMQQMPKKVLIIRLPKMELPALLRQLPVEPAPGHLPDPPLPNLKILPLKMPLLPHLPNLLSLMHRANPTTCLQPSLQTAKIPLFNLRAHHLYIA